MSRPGWHEASDGEKDTLDRGLCETRKKLEKLHEKVCRALIEGGHSDALMREAIAILRRDPPVQWENVDGYEQMEFFEWVADRLELAYFPTSARTKARTRASKQAQCTGYRGLIDILANREGISKAKALIKVAEDFGTKPEALAKRLQRYSDKPKKTPRSRRRIKK